MRPDGTQFARRVLLVSSDKKYVDRMAASFREQRYEVMGARDGFEALLVLRGALPDLLICELSLPHMSGFELLSVVRTRFPQIAVIATSSEYNSTTMPHGTIADAFVSKSPDREFELLMTARDLIADSPLRGTMAKAELAPVWIPCSPTGYVVLTCPDCLRSFSIAQPDPTIKGPLQENCVACGKKIRYQIVDSSTSPPEPLPTEKAQDVLDKAKAAKESAQQTVARTQTMLKRHKSKR